eukprot:21116-Heterococcus_DN1.PRE.3
MSQFSSPGDGGSDSDACRRSDVVLRVRPRSSRSKRCRFDRFGDVSAPAAAPAAVSVVAGDNAASAAADVGVHPTPC